MPKRSAVPRPTVRDLLAEATTMSLTRACEYIGVSRSQGYDLAKDAMFPVRVLRIGTSYKVATADLMRYLGVGQGPLTTVAAQTAAPARRL